MEKATENGDDPRRLMVCTSGLRSLLFLGCLTAMWAVGCDGFEESLDCRSFVSEHQRTVQAGGELLSEISTGLDGFAMALVLNKPAVNSLFQNLSDLELPTLSQTVGVLGFNVRVSVNPQIPLLQIGGERRCVECFLAEVPFNASLAIDGMGTSAGSGQIRLQLPVGMTPEGLDSTAFLAHFQSVEVLSTQLNFGNEFAASIYDAAEPLISDLLTSYLRTRFQDARIATFRSWSVGSGAVRLAGRGPLVFPDEETVVIAMQSNLPAETSSLNREQWTRLPSGADFGVLFDPSILGAMGRRMTYEEVIPHSPPNADALFGGDGGGTAAALLGIQSEGSDRLRSNIRLWRLQDFCGSLDLSAALGLTFVPQGVSFFLGDITMGSSRGSGNLISHADSLAEGWVQSLIETLDLTVNYDGILGGETQQDVPMETFRASIDGGGVNVFFNLLGNN